jgi:CO dehydrogenase/acetyl-CoA synthase epsilon subunit
MKEEGQKDFDPHVVPNDEATMIGDVIVAQMTYDGDNPKLVVGSTFIDKDDFMLLMKQYAIKKDFETFVVHSDRSRYRAKCIDLECDWKIYTKKFLSCLHSW